MKPRTRILGLAGGVAVAAAGLAPTARAAAPPAATITVAVGGFVAEASARSIGIVPHEVVFHDGDLFVSDGAQLSIRRIDLAAGTLTTVAGTGLQGAGTGDGGPARAAQMQPGSFAFRPDGSIVMTDGTTDSLRSFRIGGTIEHVATVVSADRVAVRADGSLVVAADDRLLAVGTDGAVSTIAHIGYAGAVIAAADGSVVFSDVNQRVVGRVAVDGTITTVASGFVTPTGLAFDASGRLYVSDFSAGVVYRVAPDGTMQAVAGRPGESPPTSTGDGGPAQEATLDEPWSLAFDPASGALAIAERYGVRLVNAGGIISTVAGNGEESYAGEGTPATSTPLAQPKGLAVDRATGALYVSDMFNHRVRRVEPDGTVVTVAGNGREGWAGDGGPAIAAEVARPAGLALDGDGNLYIADGGGYRIRKVDRRGIISTVAGGGSSDADGIPATSAFVDQPVAVAVDAAGRIYFSEYERSRVRVVGPGGIITTVAGTGTPGFTGDGGPARLAALSHPSGIALDGSGNLYIADYHNGRIRRVGALGRITTVAGPDTIPAPYALAVEARGRLLFTGPTAVMRLRGDGTVETVAGCTCRYGYAGDGGPALDATLSWMSDLETDAAGGVYVTNFLDHQVRRISTGAAPPVPAAPVVPTAPQDVHADAGASFASLRWAAPAQDGGQPILGYDVVARAGGTVVGRQRVAADVRSASLAGLAPGTAYEVRVDAFTARGAGAPAAVGVTPVASGAVVAPAAAVALRAWRGDGFVSARWAPPASDGGSAIVAYTVAAVDRATGAPVASLTTAADVRSASLTGIPAGAVVDVSTVAWTAYGHGLPATVAPTAVALVAAAPPPVHAYVNPLPASGGDRDVKVTWLAADGDNGAPLTSYTVVARARGATVASATLDTAARRVTLTHVPSDVPVKVSVYARNAVGLSPAARPTLLPAA